MIVSVVLWASIVGAAQGEIQTPARGWSSIARTSVISQTFERTDVHDALRRLFAPTGVRCWVDPGVKGTVTVEMNGVSFETALWNLTLQTESVFVEDRGDLIVFPSEEYGRASLTPEERTGLQRAYTEINRAYVGLVGSASGRGMNPSRWIAPEFVWTAHANEPTTEAESLRRLLVALRATEFHRTVGEYAVNQEGPATSVVVFVQILSASHKPGPVLRDLWSRNKDKDWRLVSREDVFDASDGDGARPQKAANP